jgi:hypothetical protein
MVTVWPSLEIGTATVADVEMLDVRMVGAVGAACGVGGLVGVRPGGSGGAEVPGAVPRRIGGGAGGGKRAPEGGGTEGAACGGAAGGGSGAEGGGSEAAAGSVGLTGSEPGGFVTAGPRGTAGMGGGTTISVLPPAVSVPPGGITTPTSVFGFPGSGGGAPEGTGSGGGMLSHPLSISIDSPLSRSPSSDLPVLLSVPATISDATQDAVQAKGGGERGTRRRGSRGPPASTRAPEGKDGR